MWSQVISNLSTENATDGPLIVHNLPEFLLINITNNPESIEQVPHNIDDLFEEQPLLQKGTDLEKKYILRHMVFRHGEKLTTFSLEHETDWKWQGYHNDKWMSGDRDQFRGSLAKWKMKPILLVYEAIKTAQPDSFKFYTTKEAEEYMQAMYVPSAEDEESMKIAKQLQAEFDQQ